MTFASADTVDPTVFPSASQSEVPDNPDDWTPPSDWETPPPADQQVQDPVTVSSADPSAAPLMSPLRDPDCTGTWDILSAKGFPYRVGRVGVNFSSYFGAGGSQTLTSGITGTVGVTVSASGGASLSAEVVSVKADLGVSVSVSASVTASDSETQSVKAGYWGECLLGPGVVSRHVPRSILCSLDLQEDQRYQDHEVLPDER